MKQRRHNGGKIRKPHKTGFFAMLLALLGIGGCHTIDLPAWDDPFGRGAVCMYGVPTAHYSVKGQVTNEEGTPIPGIDVTFFGVYQESPGTQYGTDPFGVNLKTDSSGTYVFNSQRFPYPQVRIQFDDTDGPANGGEFESADALVDIKFDKSKNDNNPWNSGDAKVTVPTIKLKKK